MANRKPLINGGKINFTITFLAQTDTSVYADYLLSDILPVGLAFDKNNSSIKVGSTSVGTFNENTGATTVTADVANTATVAGNSVVVTLATTIIDASVVPTNMEYENQASIKVNSLDGLLTESNKVTADVVFPIELTEVDAVPSIVNAINNESVALKTLIKAKKSDNTTDNHKFADFATIVLTNVIGPGLAYDSNSVTTDAGATSLTVVPDISVANQVTLTITNLVDYDAKDISVTIGTKVKDIPTDPNGTYPTAESITNKFDNYIDNQLASSSTPATIKFRRRLTAVVKDVL